MAQFTRPNGVPISGGLTLHAGNKLSLRLIADPAEKNPFKLASTAPLLAQVAGPNPIGKGPSLQFVLSARGVGSTTISASTSTTQGTSKPCAILTLVIEPRIELPDLREESGAVARLLLAETRSPWASGYDAGEATQAMKWMKLVLANRLRNNPAQFRAASATSLVHIIKAPGQFEGFAGYPKLSDTIRKNVADILEIANNDAHSKQAAFADHVRSAIAVANEAPIGDPCPTKLYGWRTKGSGSPGTRFELFKSVGGNDFYTLK